MAVKSEWAREWPTAGDPPTEEAWLDPSGESERASEEGELERSRVKDEAGRFLLESETVLCGNEGDGECAIPPPPPPLATAAELEPAPLR